MESIKALGQIGKKTITKSILYICTCVKSTFIEVICTVAKFMYILAIYITVTTSGIGFMMPCIVTIIFMIVTMSIIDATKEYLAEIEASSKDTISEA